MRARPRVVGLLVARAVFIVGFGQGIGLARRLVLYARRVRTQIDREGAGGDGPDKGGPILLIGGQGHGQERPISVKLVQRFPVKRSGTKGISSGC